MKYFIFLSCIIFSQTLYSQDQEEKEFNFSKSVLQNIKEEIKSDRLLEFQKKKEEKISTKKVIKTDLEKKQYFYPKEGDAWKFLSEYWLVKNASILKWDFDHPEYGIEASFESLLESVGLLGKKFKVLVLNTPLLYHGAIPSNDSVIYLVSLPFMRTLDLSKSEISLLLLENYIRVEASQFKKNLNLDVSWFGESFKGSEVNLKRVTQILNAYTRVLTKDGFNYKQQFETTKRMDAYLKGIPKLRESYIKLLSKIDELTKKNSLYEDYIKIYPSPSMQIGWLTPKKNIL